jgi:high-affinity iron transporter
MLLACAILFMIGHWLVGQAEAQHWNSFIRAHLKSSLSGGSRRTLWFTVFLAVFREGAEVVLFYQALWLGSGARESTQLIGGFLLGCLALGAIFVTFKFGVLRIPIRPFFRVTGALLFYLAFAFAGKSIVELQAGGYLLVNEMHGWPTINALGIYPTVQSLGLQAFMLMLLAASLIWTFAIRNRNSSPEQGV